MNAKTSPSNTTKTVDLQDLEIGTEAAEALKGGRREVTREEWERIVAKMMADAKKNQR